MECLASHSGREIFLVHRAKKGAVAVPECYDRAFLSFQVCPGLLRDISRSVSDPVPLPHAKETLPCGGWADLLSVSCVCQCTPL